MPCIYAIVLLEFGIVRNIWHAACGMSNENSRFLHRSEAIKLNGCIQKSAALIARANCLFFNKILHPFTPVDLKQQQHGRESKQHMPNELCASSAASRRQKSPSREFYSKGIE